MAQRYRTNCGAELGDEARFCPSCGKPVHETATVPTPEADVPVPPPPQRQAGGAPNFGPTSAAPRQRSMAGRLFVGCAGLFVLGILFVGCLAVLGSGEDGGTTADGGNGQEQAAQQEDQGLQKGDEQARQQAEEEAAQEAEEQRVKQERQAAEEQEQVEAAIGETVRAGDAEWTVTSARRTRVLSQKGFGQFGESKQGNFVVMDFTFTNIANEAVTLDTLSLPMFDGEGRQYEADTDTFGYIPAQKDIFLNQVNPGVTQEGRIIYSVAPDSKDFQVRAGDLSLFGDEEARINLGF